jgi:MFS family permease
MLPIALLVGRTADSWGRKPLFLAGFAILPIRAVLYTLSDNSFWLIGVQLLDAGRHHRRRLFRISRRQLLSDQRQQRREGTDS